MSTGRGVRGTPRAPRPPSDRTPRLPVYGLFLLWVGLFGCRGTDSSAESEACDPKADQVCESGAFLCDGDALRLCDPCGTGYVEGAVDCGVVGFGCGQGRCLADPDDKAYFLHAARLDAAITGARSPFALEEALAAGPCHANRHPFRCANGRDDDGDGRVDDDDRDCRGPQDKDEAALRDRIIEGAGLGPLLKGGDPTPPVRSLSSPTRDADGYRERLVYLEHAALGFVEVRLLLPPPAGAPVPVVLGLHGHGGDAAMFRDALGAGLARQGIAVAAPSFRAMAFDQRETTLAMAMIRARGALLGLRVAEALMVLQWLQDVPEVDAARVGLLGHSGGAMAALLVPRLHPVEALHFDHQDTYGWNGRRVDGDTAPLLQCSPDGVWVFEEINDTDTLGIPVRRGDHARWGRYDAGELEGVGRFFLDSL